MMEIVVSVVGILVGLAIYKEGRLNAVTISAAWLGFFVLLLLSNIGPLPPVVSATCLALSVAALAVLCWRFPMLWLFVILVFLNLATGRPHYPNPYWRYRRWW